ncbi:MAG: hypothetical protein H0V17_28715 [Deltaproteobacteria bacterium]|nr:hypothetical protein [Deltaproteobacteria bacterium]
MTDPATRPRSRLGAIPAAVLVVVAIWEIVATRCQATSVPGDDEWAAAARHVRTGYQPGDLIVFAPSWADPIGRLHLGDLIPLEMAGRMDAVRYGRIWELSMRGAFAPEVNGLSAMDYHAGPVEVRRYERAAPRVLFDLTATPSPGARIDLVEVAFEPHRCLVVPTPPMRPYLDNFLAALDTLPPGPQRERMLRVFDTLLPELAQARAVPKADRLGKRITVNQVPIGTELAIGLGIADVFTRRDERRPIALTLELTGQPQPPPLVAPIDEWVVSSVDFATPPPAPVDITFVLRWEANPGETTSTKQVCLAMESRT